MGSGSRSGSVVRGIVSGRGCWRGGLYGVEILSELDDVVAFVKGCFGICCGEKEVAKFLSHFGWKVFECEWFSDRLRYLCNDDRACTGVQ
jgi:hypothetical protein